MNYLALLIGAERDRTPEEGAAEMAAYESFHQKAASAIRAGDALAPAADAVVITGGPDAPVITDGPFPEGAEVAGGYYIFEAENLDEALSFASDVPEAKHGAVEVWPTVEMGQQFPPLAGTHWLALLLEPHDKTNTPGSPEWDAAVRQHGVFAQSAGQHIKTGVPLHPPSTATTVRVRDGETLVTDGPYVEGAEVANGYYILAADDRDTAVRIASQIPATTVQVRQLLGISGI